VSMAVVAIVFAQVLMPTLVTGVNTTYNVSGQVYTTSSSALSFLHTS
jgi:hypothetical protein